MIRSPNTIAMRTTTGGIVVNSLTGSIDLLDPTDFSHYVSGDFDRLSSATLDYLIGRRYLFSSSEEHRGFFLDLAAAAQRTLPLFPVMFIICPTYGCNLRCPYCFQEQQLHYDSRHLTQTQVEKAFAAIDAIDAVQANDYRISLFGGEPLLTKNKAIVQSILLHTRERGRRASVTTNGTAIKQYLDVIDEYAGTLIGFQITVDGPRQVHDARRVFHSGMGTFDLIIDGLKELLKRDVIIGVRINVDRANITALPELCRFIIDEGLVGDNIRYNIALVRDHTELTQDSKLLTELECLKTLNECQDRDSRSDLRILDVKDTRLIAHIDKAMNPKSLLTFQVAPSFYYCEANAGKVLVFGRDDLIYPCTEAIGDHSKSVGRYAPDFFLDQTKWGRWRSDVTMHPECMACEVVTFCGGGCSFSTLYTHGGKLSVRDCEERRRSVREYIAYVANKYLDLVVFDSS